MDAVVPHCRIPGGQFEANAALLAYWEAAFCSFATVGWLAHFPRDAFVRWRLIRLEVAGSGFVARETASPQYLQLRTERSNSFGDCGRREESEVEHSALPHRGEGAASGFQLFEMLLGCITGA